jgi:hypothetical protein
MAQVAQCTTTTNDTARKPAGAVRAGRIASLRPSVTRLGRVVAELSAD